MLTIHYTCTLHNLIEAFRIAINDSHMWLYMQSYGVLCCASKFNILMIEWLYWFSTISTRKQIIAYHSVIEICWVINKRLLPFRFIPLKLLKPLEYVGMDVFLDYMSIEFSLTHTYAGLPCFMGTFHRCNVYGVYLTFTHKPTNHIKLQVFSDLNNLFCMIYKLFYSWGPNMSLQGQGFWILPSLKGSYYAL